MHYLIYDILPVVGVIIFGIPFTSVLSILAALFVWKLFLGSRPIRLFEAVLLFAVSAPTACGVYAHGPAPVVWMALADDPEMRGAAFFWAVVVGVAVTGLSCWRSHRRGRAVNPHSH